MLPAESYPTDIMGTPFSENSTQCERRPTETGSTNTARCEMAVAIMTINGGRASRLHRNSQGGEVAWSPLTPEEPSIVNNIRMAFWATRILTSKGQ